MMGKEWTRRDHDADIIQLEVIPALRRALWVMPNVSNSATGDRGASPAKADGKA